MPTMQVFTDKIEGKIAGVCGTPLFLINPIYNRGVNQMTFRSVAKTCSVLGCVHKHFGRGLCNMHYKRWRQYGDTSERLRLRNICEVNACTGFVKGRGLCNKHYARLYRHGSVADPPPPLDIQYPESFWQNVAVTVDSEMCWEWRKARDKGGYGQTSYHSKTVKAHRVAFFFTHGYWPDVVRHTCDNPPCCNPHHLLPGTPLDNAHDRTTRDRNAKGERSGCSVLRDVNVREIRRRVVLFPQGVGRGHPNSQASLAREFGVSRRTIYLIATNQIWRHVT